ncbi:hypothetical protein F9B85_13470 [Heliorestis acidaminivorans]|uniref:Uncharacterized protein n=1 Tax=Heliorestis acidaminivorans TaxID=553427 RepID=A0A6I0EPH1_9FIRM|nr:hypothetical protein [Heliorestis acidaminivorans]KAB2951069.1 hypothetical protein F9B85_13470 [Heliorestis acidaminivorans]
MKTKLNYNPRLLQILTNKKEEEIPVKPGIALLPSNYKKIILDNIEDIIGDEVFPLYWTPLSVDFSVFRRIT